MEPFSSSPAPVPRRLPKVRLRRQTLESLLEEIQRALDTLRDDDLGLSLSVEASEAPEHADSEGGRGDDDSAASLASDSDYETEQVRRRLRFSGSLGFGILIRDYEALVYATVRKMRYFN